MSEIQVATPGDRFVPFRIYQKSIPLIFSCFILIHKYVQFLWNWYDWKVNKLNFCVDVILVFFVTHKKCVLECESEYTSRIAGPPCAARCETRPIKEGVFKAILQVLIYKALYDKSYLGSKTTMTSGEWTCLISFATAPLTCSERGGSEKFKMKIYVSSGIRTHAPPVHDRKVAAP